MKMHSFKDPHMMRAKVSFLKAVYTTIGIFLMLFILSHIGGALYVSSLATHTNNKFQAGIAKDLEYLKTQGDEVAENDLVQKYLVEQDSGKLLDILQKELEARSIGTMGVANSEGVIVSRTKKLGVQGDNVFLTFPEGRIVAKGESVQTIGQSIIDPTQLRMTTGRPIIHDGRMIGGLFANYLMDDTYAVRFRDSYLGKGVEVLFYNTEFGIYGDSFTDGETRKLVNSYFNSGSDWIQNTDTDKTISFKNGSFYFVKNITFPGIDKSSTGALLLIPRKDISNIANIVTALIVFFIFILFALLYHFHSHGEERGWRYWVMLSLLAMPVFGVVLFALHVANVGFLQLERIPYVLYNSTLRLQPESGIYDLGFEQRFGIVVDTGDEAINGVSIGLQFDPNMVEVKAIDTTHSVCAYIVENTINSKEGKALFNCIFKKYPAGQVSLPVADVVVVPRQTGNFTLSFDQSDTQVLANDGLGTNVLRMSQSGSYTVGNFDTGISKDGDANINQSFIVFSPTHPNQSRWYNAQTARFIWRGLPGAVYAYTFDSSPNTVPTNTYTVQGNSIDIPIPGDGIFYFHLKLLSTGIITHYKIESDEIPPTINSIHLNADKVFAGDVVRFSFDAEDKGSGIQHNFYVDLGNHLFLPVGSQLFIPFLEAGDQKMILRVYDNAGNYGEKSQIIHVEKP